MCTCAAQRRAAARLTCRRPKDPTAWQSMSRVQRSAPVAADVLLGDAKQEARHMAAADQPSVLPSLPAVWSHAERSSPQDQPEQRPLVARTRHRAAALLDHLPVSALDTGRRRPADAHALGCRAQAAGLESSQRRH